MIRRNKLIFSFLLGIFGIVCLFFQWNSEHLYPFAYPSSSSARKLLEKFIHFLPSPVDLIIDGYIAFAFGFVFFFSIIGVFLGAQCLSYKRNLAILAVIFNLFNFFLSLLIAWLLFGLARGM